MKLKPTDEKLLHMIQEEGLCVPQVSKLAQSLKVPVSTIHARIKKLQSEGIIKGYTPILDAEKLGKGLSAFLLGQCKVNQDLKTTAKKLKDIKGVQEIFQITGDWDFMIKIKVKDEEELTLISQEINEILGLRGKTIVSTKTVKELAVVEI